MPIPPSFIEDLKSRVSVSDVVGKRVKLNKKGQKFWGLCPFHGEKTPSFSVDDGMGFYHCFGCGEHGSALDFLMKTEGLGFREAVERLADSAGMQVPEESPEQARRTEKRKSLLEVVELACAFYERSLRMPEGREGLEYFYQRGLSDQTIKHFRLGYALGQSALKAALSREGVSEEAMIAAGLIIQPEDRNRQPYDRFRERVLFPITDRQGRVIAFGGRTLQPDGKPKYLNSPDTDLFLKGNILYGLAQAREAAYQARTIIVTEGYMDVIALAQAGFAHSVAPLGTALTEEQIQLLWKFAPEPLLCFDGDAAGQRAAARAAERALPHLKPGFGLRFVTLPEGEDPDSLIKREGVGAMKTLLEGAKRLSDMLWDMETHGRSLSSPEERASLEKRLKDHAFSITDETTQRHYLSALKDRLWATIKDQKRPTRSQGKKGVYKPDHHPTQLEATSGSRVQVDLGRLREQILLAALVNHPGLYDDVGERLGLMGFTAPALDKLRQDVLRTLDGDPGLDSRSLQNHLVEHGFAAVLKTFLGPRLYGHAYFVKPEEEESVVRDGWEETFRLYLEKDFKPDLEEAERMLAEKMSQENYDKLVSLQKLAGLVDPDTDPIDTF